jgi:hypothetical protein
VFDAKLGRRHARFVVERVCTVQEMTLFQEGKIRRLKSESKRLKRVLNRLNKLLTHLRKTALIVQYVNNTIRFLGYQVDARLVVHVVDYFPVDSLPSVFLLFDFEYVLVEVELECLVGVVYAELFESIRCKVL